MSLVPRDNCAHACPMVLSEPGVEGKVALSAVNRGPERDDGGPDARLSIIMAACRARVDPIAVDERARNFHGGAIQ